MMSIGGYFELEIREGKHFHQGAIKLSTARQCFEYILKARRYTKVYIPYYTCDVIIEPLMKLNVKYEYYHIIVYWILCLIKNRKLRGFSIY